MTFPKKLATLVVGCVLAPVAAALSLLDYCGVRLSPPKPRKRG